MAAKARILAIDDQLYFRNYLEGLLAEEDYEVRTAEGHESAQQLLRGDEPFDLVIMDLVVPGADGIDALGRIRDAAPDSEVIVLTSLGDVASVVAAMRQGASDYLLKPVDRESLLRSIGSVLARRKLRQDNARLVDENLEFMSRLSLHERAIALLGAEDLAAASQGILELLADGAGASDGHLWLRSPRGGEFELATALLPGTAPTSWTTGEPALDARVEHGEVVHQPRAGQGRSVVPLVGNRELLGIATLEDCAVPGGHDMLTGQKLASIVLANARRMSRLSADGLFEPRTGLPTRGFLETVLDTEIAKAHRFGRRLACLCVEPRDLAEASPEAFDAMVGALAHTLRDTDVLCSEDARRFWILVTSTDALGGVVLKRRLAERLAVALQEVGPDLDVALGVASYPVDGESRSQLMATALERVSSERTSTIKELGLEKTSTLGEIGALLLGRAKREPRQLVPEAAEFLVSELSCRLRDRGLLFVAPGPDAASVLGPLAALGDAEISTEVFVATDGDTVPSGCSVTAVVLPPDVSPQDTWLVRFGEAPPYALIAGPPAADGTRPVFHSDDPGLVEHLTFRLRAEVGFGVSG